MARHHEELLGVAKRLLDRMPGQRGRLPGAQVRRSVSTSYYALFHFILSEVADRAVGTGHALRVRRRVLTRTVTHRGAKLALERIRGSAIDTHVQDYFGLSTTGAPSFARNLANTFVDAQAKRHDADYDLNAVMSEDDASILIGRIERDVAAWEGANSPIDRDFKNALALLILLNGKLRAET